MDLIYTNSKREDQGVLLDYEMDLAFGQDENNFECTISSSSHCCEAGSYLYMEGTEYGGIVDSIQSRSVDKEVVYSGRTWHGIIGSKVILPLQAGETAPSGVTIKTTDSSGKSIVGRYLIISGDAHDCIRFILSRIGLSDMFTAPATLYRINIDKYQFNRYTDAYNGIVQMLSSAGQKLKLTYTGGMVVLSSVDKLDYSHDEEFNSELVEFDVKKSYKKINHLVCLGSGKLENRMIVNLYADKDGNISQTQTQFGVDEYTSTFEYPNVESEEELISNGIEKMQALLNSDKISVDFDERMDEYDVGDTVGTFDAVTGLRIIATITKKIITIKNGQINIDISTDSNSSYSTGGESNTGRSDAVKSVNGMTGEVEITAADIGAVPTSRKVNGKALSADISLAASDVGAVPTSRKVNGKALSADITLAASDVGAVPKSRTVNGKALSANITLAASDVGAVPTSRTINGKALSSNISLAFSNLANEFVGSGTDGTNGYVAFAQLKITGSYTNSPIEFELISRGRPTSCLVSVQFANANSTDPALSKIYYRGSSYGVFIQKTATSTWLLYYQKSEGYDRLTVKRVSAPSQSITITHPGSFVTSKPTSNVTNATPYELEKTYPVGAIYISTSSTSPASLFGGTWEQMKDRFLIGAGGSYSAGSTGGASTHTLTANEIPSHRHTIKRQQWFESDKEYDSSSSSIYSWKSGIGGTTSKSYYGYVENTGGGAAHNNMPPYLSVYMWKRVS